MLRFIYHYLPSGKITFTTDNPCPSRLVPLTSSSPYNHFSTYQYSTMLKHSRFLKYRTIIQSLNKQLVLIHITLHEIEISL